MCGNMSSLSETMSTVGNSELDICRVVWKLPRDGDMWEGPERPFE